MKSLYEDLTTQIAQKISENYDDLIFSMIECYGITRENWRDHIDRIQIIQTGWNKHWYIDNVYAFSIMETSRLIADEDISEYKCQVQYRVEIIDSMKGELWK